MIFKAYKTTICRGGKLGNFEVRPALSKRYGIIIAKSEKEVDEIESQAAFGKKIFEMKEIEKGTEINEVVSHASVNPKGTVTSHPILRYMTSAELFFCYGLSEEAYKAMKVEAMKIAEADKGVKFAEEKVIEEAEKEAKKTGNTAGKSKNPQLQAVKNRLNELDIPFRQNIPLKEAYELLPDGEPLKPVPTEKDIEKEAKILADKARGQQ